MDESEYKCVLDAKTMKKAEKELGENPDTRLLEVKNLRKRLEKVPGLKARTDAKFLLRFLRVRKFNQERAFNSVKKFYEYRTKHPDIFDDLKPSKVTHMLDSNYIEILKQRDDDGCRVFIIRPGNWDDERYSVIEPMKLYVATLLKIQEEEENQIHGIHYVLDLANVTLRQSLKWTPSIAKMCLDLIQAVVPLRLKRIDYVHQPSFFNQIFPVFKQFMNEKLLSRLCLKNDKYQGLLSTMDAKHWPSDLGGELIPYSNTEWKEALLNSEKEFEEENKLYGCVAMTLENDKKESSKEDASLKGLGGTFKKLDI